MESPDILFERHGVAGIVTLNRPKALNAVTHEMVRALARQLAVWANDGAVTRVIITAAGERAFSAGGHIPPPYYLARPRPHDHALSLLRRGCTLPNPIK